MGLGGATDSVSTTAATTCFLTCIPYGESVLAPLLAMRPNLHPRGHTAVKVLPQHVSL